MCKMCFGIGDVFKGTLLLSLCLLMASCTGIHCVPFLSLFLLLSPNLDPLYRLITAPCLTNFCNFLACLPVFQSIWCSLLTQQLELYSSFHVDTRNNLLTGVVISLTSPSDARINCIFLSGFTGTTRCRIQYGTDPTYMNLPYSAESTETGTAGDTVSVVLRERLNSSTDYYYTVSAVSGNFSVVVQETFTSPLYSKYLYMQMTHKRGFWFLLCVTCNLRNGYGLT